MWWDHVPRHLRVKKKKIRKSNKKKYVRVRPDIIERKEVDFIFQPLRMVPREEWDVEEGPKEGEEGTEVKVIQTAVSTNVIGVLKLPVRNVVLSNTDTETCETHEACVQALKLMKVAAAANNLPDIPYNFLIGRDGTVYEGRGWQRAPAKNGRYENLEGESIDIGHICKKGATPPIVMTVAAWDLIQYGVQTAVIDFRPIFNMDYS